MEPAIISVLLVEDDEVDREAVIRLISKKNLPYRLQLAASQPEAMELLQNHSYDIILLDYNLGVETGLDLLPYTDDTPVIIITGSGSEETAVDAMRKGASDYLIKDPDRNYLKVLPITIRTVLERTNEHQELEHLRHLLSDFVNSMPSILVGVDTEGRVTGWNRSAEVSTGISKFEAMGKFLKDIYPPLAGQIKRVRQAIQQGEPQRDELVVTGESDLMGLWEATVYPLTASNRGAVLRIDDVTERVRMEAMMVHTEKMMSIGGLAAGMAHELNNPLAGILHNIQVIWNRLTGDMPKNKEAAKTCGISLDSIKKYIKERNIEPMMEQVVEEGQRAALIVNNLLEFSNSNENRPSLQNIGHLLDKAIEMVTNNYELKNKYQFDSIRIIRQYHSPLPKIICEAGKIQQVFFNVIKNSVQAMDLQNPDRIIRLQLDLESDYLCIRIEDNGAGMDQETQRRLFEPFFTTRSVGEGTGLGLSVSYFIITRDHNGTLGISSGLQKGTTVIIKLPLQTP